MRIDGRQAQMLSESESFKLLNTLRSQPAFCFHDDANNDEQNNDVAPGESYPLLSPAYINPPRSPFSSITTSLSSTRIQPPKPFIPLPTNHHHVQPRKRHWRPQRVYTCFVILSSSSLTVISQRLTSTTLARLRRPRSTLVKSSMKWNPAE